MIWSISNSNDVTCATTASEFTTYDGIEIFMLFLYIIIISSSSSTHGFITMVIANICCLPFAANALCEFVTFACDLHNVNVLWNIIISPVNFEHPTDSHYSVTTMLMRPPRNCFSFRVTTVLIIPPRQYHLQSSCMHCITWRSVCVRLQVLPRQTCMLFTHTILIDKFPGSRRRLDNGIYGGELFQTILFNQVSEYFTYFVSTVTVIGW